MKTFFVIVKEPRDWEKNEKHGSGGICQCIKAYSRNRMLSTLAGHAGIITDLYQNTAIY